MGRLVWAFVGLICRLELTLNVYHSLDISADDKFVTFVVFFIFFKKTGFDISCKLSPVETICMNCQICFLEKVRNILECCLLKILPRVLLLNVKCSRQNEDFVLYNLEKMRLGIIKPSRCITKTHLFKYIENFSSKN